MHDTGESTDHKHGDKAKCEQHRCETKCILPPHCTDPIENFNAGGYQQAWLKWKS